MIPKIYRDVVDGLHAKTTQDSVEWNTTVNENEFLVYFDKFTLSIRASWDDDEHERVILFTLKNDLGKNIDSFRVPESEPAFTKVAELFDAARRKANRVDEALAAIANELKESKTIGRKGKNGDDDEVPF